MTELKKCDRPKLQTLKSVQSIDSYDEIIDEQNLTPDDKDHKRHYFKSIFSEVGEISDTILGNVLLNGHTIFL